MADDPTRPDDRSLAERWRRSQEDDAARLKDEGVRGQTPADPSSVPAAAPATCPSCQSADVTTTGKGASADAYWRCAGCGEVWNVGRHREGARHARDRPFGR